MGFYFGILNSLISRDSRFIAEILRVESEGDFHQISWKNTHINSQTEINDQIKEYKRRGIDFNE